MKYEPKHTLCVRVRASRLSPDCSLLIDTHSVKSLTYREWIRWTVRVIEFCVFVPLSIRLCHTMALMQTSAMDATLVHTLVEQVFVNLKPVFQIPCKPDTSGEVTFSLLVHHKSAANAVGPSSAMICQIQRIDPT